MFVFVSVLVEGGRRLLHDRRVALLFFRGRSVDRRLFLLTGCEERNATQNTNVFLHTSESNLRRRSVVTAMRPKAMTQDLRRPSLFVRIAPRRNRYATRLWRRPVRHLRDSAGSTKTEGDVPAGSLFQLLTNSAFQFPKADGGGN